MVSELQAAHNEMLILSKQIHLLSTRAAPASWLKNDIGSSCVLKPRISCFTVQSYAYALNKMGPENTRQGEMNRRKRIVIGTEIHAAWSCTYSN